MDLPAFLNPGSADLDTVRTGSKSGQLFFGESVNERKGSGCDSASHYDAQIILLTKMLANIDLVFYDFSNGQPAHTWHDAKRLV